VEEQKPVLRGTRKKSLVTKQLKLDSEVASMVEDYIRYLDEVHGEILTESEVYEQAVRMVLRRDAGFMEFRGQGTQLRRRHSGRAAGVNVAEKVPVG
jgi:hypothetical protein